ncbi:MAG: cell division protein SepF [Thermoplasmata archaeon]|nr:cell division protein SepF [Thermoplasmata archaeon]
MAPLFKPDRKKGTGYEEEIEEEYINLGDLLAKERGDRGVPASLYIKVADMNDVTDMQVLSKYVYDGNILILNITNIVRDEERFKDLTAELTKLVKDVDGDLAGVGPQMLVVTPSGIKIDRERIKVEEEKE